MRVYSWGQMESFAFCHTCQRMEKVVRLLFELEGTTVQSGLAAKEGMQMVV